MNPTPVWTGRVLPGGLLVIDKPKDYARWVRSFHGRFVEIIVRKLRTQRSLDQNAYIHVAPIPILAEYFGYTIPECKLVLMGECWGWKKDRVSGRDIPIKPSTSEMSVEECHYFIEWVIPWAMVNYDVAIPLPHEAAA